MSELHLEGSHHLLHLLLLPASSSVSSSGQSLKSREPFDDNRNLSSKVSSKNIVIQPIFYICSQEDYETLCHRYFEGHVHYAFHIPPSGLLFLLTTSALTQIKPLESQLYGLLTVWPLANYMTSLSLDSLIFQIWI